MHYSIRLNFYVQRARAVGVFAAVFGLSPTQASACSSEPYIGSICVTAATFCPYPAYVEAAGQVLPIQQNTALFSLIGTIYGGNGATTFQLPDLRGRSPVGSGQGVGLTAVSQGAIVGSEVVALTTVNLPPHTHSATFSGGAASTSVNIPIMSYNGVNVTSPTGPAFLTASPPNGLQAAQIWSVGSTPIASVAGVTASTSLSGSITVGSAGSGAAFSNRPPQLGLLHCIAVQGLFPSRP